MNNDCKESKFFVFKAEKETFFPWEEEIEFELVELTLPYEEQNKLKTQIEAIKIELYCQLSN